MSIDVVFVELKICAEVRAGFPFRGAVEEVVGGSVGVVQMKDFDPGGDVAWTEVARTELEGRRVPGWIEAGDVLFVSRGPRFYAACVSAAPIHAVCSPHLYQLRVRSGGPLLAEFLAWQLNQTPLQRKIQAVAEGSNQLSIRRTELEALTISVPSPEAQRQVINLAKAARDEREVLRTLIANREKQLDAIALSLSESPGAADHASHESP